MWVHLDSIAEVLNGVFDEISVILEIDTRIHHSTRAPETEYFVSNCSPVI